MSRRVSPIYLATPPLINDDINDTIKQYHHGSGSSLYRSLTFSALSAQRTVFFRPFLSLGCNSDLTDSSLRAWVLFRPSFRPFFLRLLGLRRSVCVTTFSSTLVTNTIVTILTFHPPSSRPSPIFPTFRRPVPLSWSFRTVQSPIPHPKFVLVTPTRSVRAPHDFSAR